MTEQRLLDELARAAEFRAALRRFLRRTEEIVAEHGLTVQRYNLLLMIKGAPDGSEQASVGQLAERLQLRQTAVTEIVNRAAEAGLVERRRSPDDARVTLLRLTKEGERRLLRAFRALDADREAFIERFKHVDSHFRAYTSGDPPGSS